MRIAPPLVAVGLCLVSGSARPADLSRAEVRQGWIALFDAATLDGWSVQGGPRDAWRIDQGRLVSQAGPHAARLTSHLTFDDFELKLEFQLAAKDARAVVRLRGPADGPAAGHEVLIADRPDAGRLSGGLKARHDPAAAGTAIKPAGDRAWNTLDITARGPRLTVQLNGRRVSWADDSPRGAGPIVLAVEAGTARFRNLRIHDLGYQPILADSSAGSWRDVPTKGLKAHDTGLIESDGKKPVTLQTIAAYDQFELRLSWKTLAGGKLSIGLQDASIPLPAGTARPAPRHPSLNQPGGWSQLDLRVVDQVPVLAVDGRAVTAGLPRAIAATGPAPISLRIEGGPVAVRSVRVRSLPSTAETRRAIHNIARIVGPNQTAPDPRAETVIDLNGEHPWTPLPTRDAWEARKRHVRTQMLVATGLWPMPEPAPARPVIHGRIDREEYTVEKVFFSSYPGHYVSGNLYRPKGKAGRLPGVLCPHGHWPHGRFYKAAEKVARDQIKQKAEKFMSGATYPLQARCVQLARMGCVVFHYDMVGFADSTPIAHAKGFADAEAELRAQSAMGLQTYNSISALNFLLSLPDVDPGRIGVTGASGGGTQTFILCALDDRPAVAFPAVMVSTAMQGGCVCENCSLLRVNSGNIEFAAMCAPRPLGMTGANDWTLHIETRGLPQLKTHYRTLYQAADRVMAKVFPQFQHNYNQVSREVMENWMNRWLKLGIAGTVAERDFKPIEPRDLSVYDAAHPRPKDFHDAAGLRRVLTEMARPQYAALVPRDRAGLERYRAVVGTVLAHVLQDDAPAECRSEPAGEVHQPGFTLRKLWLWRSGFDQGTKIPAALYRPSSWTGRVVVWVTPEGSAGLVRTDGQPDAPLRAALDRGMAVLAPDVFLTGQFDLPERRTPAPTVNPDYDGYTFGYNRTTLARRVGDIRTAIEFAQTIRGATEVCLLGTAAAGPWAALAAASAPGRLNRAAIDLNRFSFHQVKTTADPMILPGGLKFGDLPGFVALCAPLPLTLINPGPAGLQPVRSAYAAAGAPAHLRVPAQAGTVETLVESLGRPW